MALKTIAVRLSIGLCGLVFACPGSFALQPRVAPLPAPKYTITLLGRTACVTPETHIRARADGGYIDVQTSAQSPNTLTVVMTGTPAADSYMGCTSTATQTFHLVQELEITCSDRSIQTVSLTLDSTLAGYVRSARRAGACVRVASASLTPESWEGTPLLLAHPPLCVSGTDARSCNQHLPPVQGPPMPVGRYTLIATFVLEVTAGGICNAHAVADFSPDTTLPADWVRMRDPFQGVSKRAFGFTFSITPTAPASAPWPPRQNGGHRTAPKGASNPAAGLASIRTGKASS